MGEEERKEFKSEDAEELKEVLNVISKEIPGLIKGLVSSIFSEEAGRNMGKAAAAFYKELKEASMPEDVAIKMTENYISTFTSLGDLMKRAASGWGMQGKEVEVKKESAGESEEKGE